MHGVFITGTSTNVGKTFTGVNLARQLTRLGITVIPRKPIESGCEEENGQLIPEDALALHRAANYSGSLADVCPFRFQAPISPVRAAHLGNRIFTTEQMVNICLKGSEEGFLLVEGAGGFYSPLAENGLNADLAIALQLPVLLVVNDTLGALNQVLLNVEAIQRRGLKLAGVILNRLDNDPAGKMDNAADLRGHIDCPIYPQAYCEATTVDLPDALIHSLIPDSLSTDSLSTANSLTAATTTVKAATIKAAS